MVGQWSLRMKGEARETGVWRIGVEELLERYR